jgi:hypothetical protein
MINTNNLNFLKPSFNQPIAAFFIIFCVLVIPQTANANIKCSSVFNLEDAKVNKFIDLIDKREGVIFVKMTTFGEDGVRTQKEKNGHVDIAQGPLFNELKQVIRELKDMHYERTGKSLVEGSDFGIEDSFSSGVKPGFHTDSSVYTIVMGTTNEPQTIFINTNASKSIENEMRANFPHPSRGRLRNLNQEQLAEVWARYLDTYQDYLAITPTGHASIFHGKVIHSSPISRVGTPKVIWLNDSLK